MNSYTVALSCVLTGSLLLAPGLSAQTDVAAENKPAKTTAPAQATPPNTLRLHLMDGTVITGQLQTQALSIKTAFGDLVVPIDAIISMQPGFASHPQRNGAFRQLISDLSAPDARTRDAAQEKLATFGPALIPQLQRLLEESDKDPERKVRLETLIETLYSEEQAFGEDDRPSPSLKQLDTIATKHFTIAGRVQQQQFKVRSKFGELVVNLKDIMAAQQLSTKPAEIRKAVQVSGTDMTVTAYKSTAIKIKRGDKVIIQADGKITMSPWGNNSISSPDGVAQNGMYNGTIPLGALAGRIGKNGEEFLVGSKNTFVAKQSGTLYLGFAMQANWSNYQFPGNYTARIRVIPAEPR